MINTLVQNATKLHKPKKKPNNPYSHVCICSFYLAYNKQASLEISLHIKQLYVIYTILGLQKVHKKKYLFLSAKRTNTV